MVATSICVKELVRNPTKTSANTTNDFVKRTVSVIAFFGINAMIRFLPSSSDTNVPLYQTSSVATTATVAIQAIGAR